MNSNLNDSDLDNSDNNFSPQKTQGQEKSVASLTDDLVFRLLEERLVIDRRKQKVGEVIIRKEVHTRLVEIPIRYERLIVEQVSPNPKQLAAIDLGCGEVTGIDLDSPEIDDPVQNSGNATDLRINFNSLEYAHQFLEELTQMLKASDESSQIEIVLKDQNSQGAYWSWLKQQNR